METGQEVKAVYVDSGITRVIRGILMSEDDFSFKIKCRDNSEHCIGKSALVKLSIEKGWQQ